jgi:hypothetical protein
VSVTYAVSITSTPAGSPNVTTVTIAADATVVGYVPPMPDGSKAKVTVDRPTATGTTTIRIEAAM